MIYYVNQAMLHDGDGSLGTPFRRISEALARSRFSGQQPWDALHDLANQLAVPDLDDLADIMRLCGEEGAQVYDALRAKAEASRNALLAACREVGPALFFSLLIVTVSFLPVFSLEGQEGRLFAPLAWTKTFAMGGAALLSVTLVPVLMLYFVRGRILPEAQNPVNRFLIRVYRPVIARVMRRRLITVAIAVAALLPTDIGSPTN